MGVRRKQYARELERELPKGTTARGQKVATIRSKVGSKADKFDKPSWGDKLILGILRSGKRRKGGKKPLTTARTKDISSRLKRAGISDAMIKRMKGKGK